jgi:tRNA/tmRNA/rRNA uracil-C5-methylase (TrmA/RlmC/RlmD family)
LDAACGPGIVSRHLAPFVAEIHGLDITPAMVTLARRSAEQAGVGNTTFQVADATATDLVGGDRAAGPLHHRLR